MLRTKARAVQTVTKEVAGIPVLLTRSLFACDIPSRLLLRFSPLKSTSAPVRCRRLRRTKPQFGSPQHPKPRETRRVAGEVRPSNSAAQIFQPALPPRLLPQELQRYDPLDVTLQPFVPGKRACPAPNRLPESL